MSKPSRHSLHRPCISPNSRTPQEKAANIIGKNCLGNDFTCSSCNLSLYLSVLKYNIVDGNTLKVSYKKARDQADKCIKTNQDKYDRQIHSSDLTLRAKTSRKQNKQEIAHNV